MQSGNGLMVRRESQALLQKCKLTSLGFLSLPINTQSFAQSKGNKVSRILERYVSIITDWEYMWKKLNSWHLLVQCVLNHGLCSSAKSKVREWVLGWLGKTSHQAQNATKPMPSVWRTPCIMCLYKALVLSHFDQKGYLDTAYLFSWCEQRL